ncbi:MAG: polyprenyl diphosphate synthase [Chloroflexota bacterium]|nr:polyprenyl diphosphate synthase [Chloroflexota bacterium]
MIVDSLKENNFPNHVAIIMDGNRRWAEQRGLPRLEGHRNGLENMRSVVRYLGECHVKYVSIFAFSTENWNRPQDEVLGLLRLLEDRIDHEAREFHKRGVRLRHLGGLDGLSPHLRQAINSAVELTQNNPGMTLSFAFNYGGRSEIVNAARRIISDGIPPEKVDESLFRTYLYTNGMPDVDLLIRTGGELRISNFLIWQTAYSEYYFTEVLWPDFNEQEVDKALLAYSQRQRRFGRL